MAAFSSCCVKPPPLTVRPNRLPCPRCSSRAPDKKKAASSGTGTPQILKVVVSGATELLRLFSSSSTYNKNRMSDEKREEILVSGVDDVVTILKSDYENAYFVTVRLCASNTIFSLEIAAFTSAIYAEDCIFEDPTIRFQGKELYSRNLKLLVPFFDHPSIGLQKIEKGMNSKTHFVLATWKLRTYLKLPWKPLICIDGSTVYELNGDFNIVRHAESWNVSALEAIGQIFTPSFGRSSA